MVSVSISFRKHRKENGETTCFTTIIKMQILPAHTITMSTACALFLSRYRNMILNQSAHIFFAAVF